MTRTSDERVARLDEQIKERNPKRIGIGVELFNFLKDRKRITTPPDKSPYGEVHILDGKIQVIIFDLPEGWDVLFPPKQ